MPSRRKPDRPPEPNYATSDFADDDSEKPSLSDFDTAMRGLIRVPKKELDDAIKGEKKTKKKRLN